MSYLYGQTLGSGLAAPGITRSARPPRPGPAGHHPGAGSPLRGGTQRRSCYPRPGGIMPPGPQDPRGGTERGNQRAPFTLPLQDEPVKPRTVTRPAAPRRNRPPGIPGTPRGGVPVVVMDDSAPACIRRHPACLPGPCGPQPSMITLSDSIDTGEHVIDTGKSTYRSRCPTRRAATGQPQTQPARFGPQVGPLRVLSSPGRGSGA